MVNFMCFLNKFLYTDDLTKLAKRDNRLNDLYLGTYAANLEPKNIKTTCCWIWNTDEVDKSGQHWVAIWKDENKMYFFDSFGKTPAFYKRQYWVTFANDLNCDFIVINEKQYQSLISKTCGAWSLYFLYIKSRNKDIPILYDDTVKNEVFLKNNIFTIFKRIESVYRKKCKNRAKNNQKCCTPLTFLNKI